MIGEEHIFDVDPHAVAMAETATVETVAGDVIFRPFTATYEQHERNTEPHLDGVVNDVALATEFVALEPETVSPAAAATKATETFPDVPVEERKVAATSSKSSALVLTASTEPAVALATTDINNGKLIVGHDDSLSSPTPTSEPTSRHASTVAGATDTSFYSDAIDAIARAVAIAEDDSVAQCFAQDILLRSFGPSEPSLSPTSARHNLSDASALIHDFLLHIQLDRSNSAATRYHLQTAMYHLLLASGTTSIPAAISATASRDNDPHEAAF